MKKSIFTMSLCILIILFLLLIESQRAYAQTEIPAGDVSGIWTKANSPYNINGEITIPNDSTLTIEPGVEVVFTGHYKFNVQGRLLAIGTETDTIVFTINDTTGFHIPNIPDGGWGGMELEYIASSNDSTIFEYCCFQYGKNAGGGAINSNIDKLRISHCLFRNNLCFRTEPLSGSGGAIYIWGSNPVIEYSEFCLNKAVYPGSALSIILSSDALIRNNHFHHNNSSAPIGIYQSASPTFINNLIEENHSNNNGIIYFSNDGGNAKIINNTIVNNTSSQGAIFVRGGNPIFINNIVYGNEPSQVYFDSPSSVSFYNCLIEGGQEGFSGATFTGDYENCIDVDPLFVSSNDFHLQDKSNCIGAAIDSVLINSTMYYCPPTDYEGNPRPNPSGSIPDIGAYENPLAIPAPTEIPAGDVSGIWTQANSPYNINGEITIPNDSTLTIEPGVEIVFTGHYKFNVQGRLLAIGTETDTIVFTINDTTGFHNLTIPDGGWHGIRFIGTPSSNDWSKIVYCKLQYGKANTGAGYYDRLGGALCANINKLLVSHCMFRNNTTYSTDIYVTGGGAIAIFSNPIIEFCEFTENRSSWAAAICIWDSNIHPLIKNNYFHHNLGHGTIDIGSWGGSNTSPVLINNVIANNHSNECATPDGHGIIHFSNGGGKTVLINNTIVNNTCDGPGGAIFTNYYSATPLLINNIIYGNTPAQVRLDVSSGLDFYNCLIEGGKEGFSGATFTGTYQNCIDADPQIVGLNDYHLQNTSPCIGAGIDSIQIGASWFYSPPNCYYGSIRPNPAGSMPDIGACESPEGIVGVEENLSVYPTEYALSQNYPNPFNPSTTIKYSVPELSFVTIKFYDVLGSEVATLVNEEKPVGTYEVNWNATNLPSGVYFYRLQAGDFVQTRKMILLK